MRINRLLVNGCLKLDWPQILLQTLQATDQSTLVLLSSYLAKWTAIVVALIQGAKVVFAIHPAYQQQGTEIMYTTPRR